MITNFALVVIGRGKAANGISADLQVKWFDIKYKKYWDIEDEHLGAEKVIINYDKYELDQLNRRISQDNDATRIVNDIRQLMTINIDSASDDEMRNLLQKLKSMVL